MIKIAIVVVVVVVLAVVGVVLLTGGGDDDTSADKGSKPKSASEVRKQKPEAGRQEEPATPLKTFTRGRAEGAQARAQASALTNAPTEIWVRTSAAPKQAVTVTWSLLCGEGRAVQENYKVTPPDLRQIKIPGRGRPDSCTASVAGQLAGKGRVKIAVLRDR
jgi:hypothetical protein